MNMFVPVNVSVQDYYKITRLSNMITVYFFIHQVQDYYKITRLSNRSTVVSFFVVVQDYYKITRLSNLIHLSYCVS